MVKGFIIFVLYVTEGAFELKNFNVKVNHRMGLGKYLLYLFFTFLRAVIMSLSVVRYTVTAEEGLAAIALERILD